MSVRNKQPLTNEHFAAFCEQMVGQPYWYGTCCYKATENLRQRKAKQYPSHYTASREEKYKRDIANHAVVADCIGGVKGYAWTGGGESILQSIGKPSEILARYGSNGCPDKGANGMFAYAKSKGCAWGTIDTLPEIVGLALHKNGHVGYYVGNGYAVEWKGFLAGCVRTEVKSRKWQYWYQFPFLDYGQNTLAVASTPNDIAAGNRTLEKGASGANVKDMQMRLLQLGYDLPRYGADGEFGNETLRALLRFQRDKGLTDNGLYDKETHSALADAIAIDRNNSEAEPSLHQSEAAPSTSDQEKPEGSLAEIISNGGKVNIRTGNGTQFSRITAVAHGTILDHIATAANGWHAVVIRSQVGWVSGEYARIL